MRPKHPNKDLEALLRYAEAQKWRADKPGAYFRLLCPKTCKQHQRRIHLTPSDPNYELNARKWLERQPCWKKEDGEEEGDKR
jgi:hypothetical protein